MKHLSTESCYVIRHKGQRYVVTLDEKGGVVAISGATRLHWYKGSGKAFGKVMQDVTFQAQLRHLGHVEG